jgi:formylglycine-generating enzyme required for sulfatase activity
VSCVREVPAADQPKLKQQAEALKGNYVTQDGLTWMPITSSRKTWADANNYCNSTEINGQTGWRLPTKDEWIALNDSDAKSTLKWTLGNAWLSTLYGTGNHYYFTLPNGFTGGLEDQLHAFVSCVHLVRRN